MSKKKVKKEEKHGTKKKPAPEPIRECKPGTHIWLHQPAEDTKTHTCAVRKCTRCGVRYTTKTPRKAETLVPDVAKVHVPK